MVEIDTNALGGELERQSAWMRRLVRHLVQDADAAEDVVQNTRLAAWQREQSGDPVELGWLARVALNFARRQRRDEARRREHERAGAVSKVLPPTQDLAARLDAQRVLADELNAVPEPYRSTLVRRYFDEWSAARIAREAGCPASTVRTRIERGLELLRERLDRRHDRRHDGRRTWLSALAPLALPPMSFDVPTVPASTLVPGALLMKIGLQVAAVLAVVTLASVGFLWRDSEPEAAPELFVSDVRAVDPVAVEPHVVAAPTSSEQRNVIEEPGVPLVAAAVAPSLEPTRVEARIVDAMLRPLAGVRAAIASEPQSGVESDRDGRITVDLEGTRAAYNGSLRVEARGFALQFVDARIEPGRTTRLGDIVLTRAGAAAGRVVDVEGRAIAGARVLATPLGTWEPDPESARRCGPSDRVRVPSTTSAPDGTFLLEGLAVGGVRLWAEVRGMRYGVSPPLVVRADETLTDVVLTVEPLQREDEIAGVVLTPDGDPVRGASLHVQVRSSNSSSSWSETTDADGRFRFRVRLKADHKLRAVDAQARWPEATLNSVAPGSTDLVLRFTVQRFLVASASTQDGAPTPAFELRAVAESGDEVLARSGPEDCADDRCPLPIPSRNFRVECRAAGFAVASLGPFDALTAPDRLEFELLQEAGITGRVLAHGAPRAGARVTLWRAASSSEYVEVNGYPALRIPQAIDEFVTDAEGRFYLRAEESGDHFVRAESAGFAASEIGPLDLQPGTATGGLELALGEGGRIEGVVLVAHGHSDEGVLVVANRGDGRARTTRTREGGAFSFEHLASGPWSVARGRTDVFGDEPVNWSRSTAKTPTKLAHDCEVSEGATSRIVLDLREDGPAIIAGRLLVNGAPAARWTLQAWPGGKDSFTGDLPTTALDARGEFELALEEPGPARLEFSWSDAAGSKCQVDVHVELARGRNAWSSDFATTRVEGRSARPSSETYALFAIVEQGAARSFVPIRTDADGRFVLPSVLVGRAQFLSAPIENGRWGERRMLREVTLTRGATASIDLP